jgi:hypothetical protein
MLSSKAGSPRMKMSFAHAKSAEQDVPPDGFGVKHAARYFAL